MGLAVAGLSAEAVLLEDLLPRTVFGSRLRWRSVLVRGADVAAVVMTIVPLETPPQGRPWVSPAALHSMMPPPHRATRVKGWVDA